tara:strand:+ start:121 stop:1362 length:1242 start_codon:yes stop_codon:yes gene_type:complete
MKPKIHITNNAKSGLDSDKQYKWLHLWAGKEVPPTRGGSFNHLIDDILKLNSDHVLICQYSPESHELSASHQTSIIYVEFKPKVSFKSKMKHRLTGAHIINYEDFLKKSFEIIGQIKCDNIMVWGTPLYLSRLRAAFPEKTIAYNQRYFQHAYDIANQYDYCDILLTQTIGTSKLAFEMNYAVTPLNLTIPNGVELNIFTPSSKEQKIKFKTEVGIDESKFVVLWPSKLHPYRGTSYLLNWIEYFKIKNPKIHFLIVGEWTASNLNGNSKKLDSYLKQSESVTWINNLARTDMPNIYKCADISLMPGVLREGMSMSAQESLSSGLPIIATQRGTYPELIKTDYNGILCNPENLFNEGVSGIEKLFSNAELLKKMSLNAREYAVKRLSREKALNNFGFFFNGEYSKIDNDLSIS